MIFFLAWLYTSCIRYFTSPWQFEELSLHTPLSLICTDLTSLPYKGNIEAKCLNKFHSDGNFKKIIYNCSHVSLSPIPDIPPHPQPNPTKKTKLWTI